MDVPPSDQLYWLRFRPTTPNARFTDLYLRWHGGGIPAVVLSPNPPKFLRFHLTSEGQQVATSWRESDKGRYWGFVAQAAGTDTSHHPVEMFETRGDPGLEWEGEEGEETLQWTSPPDSSGGWSGWIVLDGPHGHPQLYWLTKGHGAELPIGAEKVDIVKVPIVNQETA
ncbi:hypothetical protein BD324DRAFT_630614 [Kockovaella imperatae]|uniref:DUF7907 domain-containing protein n=1 Tax=Kockovaella imperatae TaxID=4999 RepID=A0A1Y1UBY4_9TREE|nr:hypothetical protein BD324DRAFT_630614 [Kockovaella imperatae]ORX35553.1 hypothetical protein BD324DRAFT_630614 [Kockovaella imperatae]